MPRIVKLATAFLVAVTMGLLVGTLAHSTLVGMLYSFLLMLVLASL